MQVCDIRRVLNAGQFPQKSFWATASLKQARTFVTAEVRHLFLLALEGILFVGSSLAVVYDFSFYGSLGGL